jgi:hypothetical protein
MVLRNAFGHKRKEVKGGRRMLDKGKLYDLCFSEERLVARVGDRIDAERWWANLKGRDCLGDLGIGGTILLS